MSEYKTEEPTLLKDSKNNSLLSVDIKGKQQYLARRKQMQRTHDAEDSINNMKQEIVQLKNDFSEIKDLLKQVVDKIS
tara:strand:+ start:1564 stop:1797 length:234 start_codon:yes stop_codon:yes gene_type:complete